jgi:hypothetical protein
VRCIRSHLRDKAGAGFLRAGQARNTMENARESYRLASLCQAHRTSHAGSRAPNSPIGSFALSLAADSGAVAIDCVWPSSPPPRAGLDHKATGGILTKSQRLWTLWPTRPVDFQYGRTISNSHGARSLARVARRKDIPDAASSASLGLHRTRRPRGDLPGQRRALR